MEKHKERGKVGGIVGSNQGTKETKGNAGNTKGQPRIGKEKKPKEKIRREMKRKEGNTR